MSKEEAGYALSILLDEENKAVLRMNSGSRTCEASGQRWSTPTSLASPSTATQSAWPPWEEAIEMIITKTGWWPPAFLLDYSDEPNPA